MLKLCSHRCAHCYWRNVRRNMLIIVYENSTILGNLPLVLYALSEKCNEWVCVCVWVCACVYIRGKTTDGLAHVCKIGKRNVEIITLEGGGCCRKQRKVMGCCWSIPVNGLSEQWTIKRVYYCSFSYFRKSQLRLPGSAICCDVEKCRDLPGFFGLFVNL